jgi:hypothetical protein
LRLRSGAHDADIVVSLYNLGFTVNERIEDRFQALKHCLQVSATPVFLCFTPPSTPATVASRRDPKSPTM